ncbi:hypothetical protein [Jannaschia sp. LMIT008]|uniref:hypothetical protein n=1 Tax=Jannaschia maritima TaxID=3032585 RepID=UPI002811E1F5|nr:hypothetical protein [Jannaschia sp. LMIT008]
MPRDTSAMADPEEAHDYAPPQSPEEDHPLWLAIKIGTAMFLADLVCSNLIGFSSPTWSIILAAYLSVQPPIAGRASAGRRLLAMLLGLSLGVAGAYANQFVPNGASAATFAVIGLVGGYMASKGADYLFAAVVATVITFVGQSGEETVFVEAMQAGIMILVGCIVGPGTAWTVERLRGWLHDRGSGVPGT